VASSTHTCIPVHAECPTRVPHFNLQRGIIGNRVLWLDFELKLCITAGRSNGAAQRLWKWSGNREFSQVSFALDRNLPLDLNRILFTLVPLFAPRVIPRLITFYRELRTSSSRPNVRPVPADARRALNILFIAVAVFLVLSLPRFADENIFARTEARLMTENSVLFARLAAQRPGETLTDSDLRLRDRLQTMDGRLLYLQYGHDVLANCPFCTTKEAETFLYYAAPAIAAPHLLHLAIIGFITAHTVAGPDAARWRVWAGFGALALGLAEFYVTVYYDQTGNRAAVRASDISFFHWNVRTIRYIAFALFDSVLAYLIYLAATRRFFLVPSPPMEEAIERTAVLASRIEAQVVKTQSLGALRNAVMREPKLRTQLEQYWARERDVMAEVDQDQQVVEQMNKAMGGIDMHKVQRQAVGYAELVVNSTSVAPQEGP
jgi:hypothetical protein